MKVGTDSHLCEGLPTSPDARLPDAGRRKAQFVGCPAAALLTTYHLALLASAGIQAQSAECLVVSELVTDHLVVVLNKVDLLPAEQRDRLVAKARKRLATTFALTRFKGCAMVPVAAKPGA